MTQRIKIGEKFVIINDKTQAVLKILDEAVGNKEGAKEEVRANEKIARGESIFWSFAERMEKLFGVLLSTKKVQLRPCEANLDSFAVKIFEYYQMDTRHCLEMQGISGEACTATEITNEFVLIREILMRLVLLSLSSDNLFEENEARLQVAKRFILRLKKSQLLSTKTILNGRQPTEFGLGLLTGENSPFALMRNAIELSRIIHGNRTAVRQVLETLRDYQYFIKCQILAYLNRDLPEHSFAPTEIDYALVRAEMKMLGEADPVEGRALSMRFLRGLNVASTINFLSSDVVLPQKDKVLFRYRLLSEVLALEKIMHKVDVMTDLFGWLPAITGMLKFDGIRKRISDLYQKARQLEIDPHDPYFERSKALNVLHSDNMLDPDSLRSPTFTTCEELKKLDCPEFLARVVELFESTCRDLIELQEREDILVLDQENLQRVKELLAPQVSRHLDELEVRRMQRDRFVRATAAAGLTEAEQREMLGFVVAQPSGTSAVQSLMKSSNK